MFLAIFCYTMATSTGIFFNTFILYISKLTPYRNRYFIGFSYRFRILHFSTASINSLLALLISVRDTLRSISFLEIIERLHFLIPVRNIKLRSSRILSSYRLLLGITWVLNLPLQARGVLTLTSPIPLRVKCLL